MMIAPGSEQAVAGMICAFPDRIIPLVLGKLIPADFSSRVCGAVMDVAINRGPYDFDAGAVLNSFEQFMGQTEAREQLKELVGIGTASRDIEHHTYEVKKASVARKLEVSLGQLRRTVEDVDPYELAAQVAEIGRQAITDNIGCSGTQLEAVKEAYEEIMSPQTSFLKTGFEKLDSIIQGIGKDQYMVFGARTGAGKTVFGLQIAIEVAKTGKKVLYISLEMSKKDLMKRAISWFSGVDHTKIIAGRLDDVEAHYVADAAGKLSSLPIIYEDRGRTTVEQIRLRAMQEPDLALIVIDHVGLVRPSKADERRSKYEQVSNISNSLKVLNRELHVPILALSQINRGNDDEYTEPRISQLKQSGSLEEDADIVLLLWQCKEDNGYRVIKVGKSRNGGQGKTVMYFLHDDMHLAECPDMNYNPDDWKKKSSNNSSFGGGW